MLALNRDATESARLFTNIGDRWGQLRATEEWTYVEREVEIRLTRTG